ncbi:MAG: hypothetical protein AAB511_02655 [Patescibacteria group bacterium]
MSFLGFLKKPVKNVGLVFDIGSKTVGGAIYEKDSNGSVKLLYTARESIAFQKTLTSESLLTALLRSLELVIVHLQKYGLDHLGQTSGFQYQVDSLSGVFSSPWHISETKILKLKQDAPFLITETSVNDLLAKEEKDFMSRLLVGGQSEAMFNLLEHKIIEIRLNGYPTSDPYGKYAEEIELSIFTSVSPKKVHEKIKALILRHFPSVEHFDSHTFSLSAFASIRDFFTDIEHFFVVQVGGEVTDITIAKKGLIAEAVSFPLGHNQLLRSLSKICHGHPGCTLEGLLSLYKEGKIHSEDRPKVERAIADAKLSWLELFNNAISNFSAETFLPKTVFLFEERVYSSVFEDFLKSAESSQFTITAEPFEIKTSDEFRAVFANLGQPLFADTILALEANFIARLQNKS